MKILFFDLINDGHHFFYNYNVMKVDTLGEKYYLTGSDIVPVEEGHLKDIGIEVIKINNLQGRNRLWKVIWGFIILIQLRRKIAKYNINTVVLLYLDQMMISLYLLQFILPIRCKIIGTLHWFPNKSLKIKSLKKLSDKGLTIIVHTDDVKSKMTSIGINAIKVIYYPILKTTNINKSQAKSKLNLVSNNNITILYFGGTRFDKGLDLFLEALKRVKIELNVIIAGQEQQFSRKFIEQKINDLSNKNIILKLDYIRDEDIELYFKSSDIVVLPYRKIFNGESGILTEAINNMNIIIVPEIIHFPDVINKYSNGVLYQAEDIQDLSEKICYVVNNINKYDQGVKAAYQDYNDQHSIEKFIDGYKQILLKKDSNTGTR